MWPQLGRLGAGWRVEVHQPGTAWVQVSRQHSSNGPAVCGQSCFGLKRQRRAYQQTTHSMAPFSSQRTVIEKKNPAATAEMLLSVAGLLQRLLHGPCCLPFVWFAGSMMMRMMPTRRTQPPAVDQHTALHSTRQQAKETASARCSSMLLLQQRLSLTLTAA